jgi:hypothetical protein
LKFVTPVLKKAGLPALFLAAALAACSGPDLRDEVPSTTSSASRPDGQSPLVQICAGQSADKTGLAPASPAIQACIDKIGPGGVLELPAGTYLMTSQLRVTFPFTLRTQGLAGSTRVCTEGAECATLKAAASFSDRYGILFVGSQGAVDHFVLDHVTLDGNRSARLAGVARDGCVKTSNTYGFNATVQNCSSCSMTYSASVNALCGTGMSWGGNFATIEHNVFARNGDHDTTALWSDGLSLVQANDSSVSKNHLIDNTDVGLISFGAARAKVEGNVIDQIRAEAFAGLMLDSLESGDFTDSSIADNKINCAAGKCFFAVNVGPRPWYPQNKPVFGGSLKGNTITGGVIGLNISGTSDVSQVMYVGLNIFLGSYLNETATCRGIGTLVHSAFSMDPDLAHAVVLLGQNFLNQVPIDPLMQSTDHCIN